MILTARWGVLVLVAGACLLAGSCVGAEEPVMARQHSSADLRVATFNIHYLSERSDALVAQWDYRSQAVITVVREMNADFVAFQEMETFQGRSFSSENRQMDTLRAAFPEFAFTATGDPREYPNTQPIMYRHARLDPMEQGYFFYSPNPAELYSDPWWGRFPSFATWVRFFDRDRGTTLLVVNVHIDRERYRNQVRSAELTAQNIAEIRHAREPVVVLGDFNAFRIMRPIRIITGSANLTVAPGNGATYHFNRGLRLFPAIDHVLVSEDWRIGTTQTVRRRPAGVWPSDHFPVVVDLIPAGG